MRKTFIYPMLFSMMCMGNAQAGAIVGGSDLIDGASLTTLEGWVGQGSLTLTNIFDKTAADNAATWHAAVDGKGATISVMNAVMSDGRNVIIGGYNPNSWHSGNDYKYTYDLADMTAFIFNLTSGAKHEQISQWQTYNGANYGPTFGGGHDIYVDSALNGGYLFPHSYCPEGLQSKALNSSCSSSYMNIAGGAGFQAIVGITALETFTVSEYVPVPAPATWLLMMLGLVGVGLSQKRKSI